MQPGKFCSGKGRCLQQLCLFVGGDLNYVDNILSTPLWVFHGATDNTVPVECSRNMVNAIRESGGNPKYTEYPGVDHDTWTKTYENPKVWDWLFLQMK